MLRYVLIRLGKAALILIGVSVIVFSVIKLFDIPPDYPYNLYENDQIDSEDIIIFRSLWDLNDPWYLQYFTFVKNASQGEFGDSHRGPAAMELVLLHFPTTLKLAVVPIGAMVLLAVPIGVMSAAKEVTLLDAIGRGVARFGQSTPPFLLGLLLIWVFAMHLEWLPRSGSTESLTWVLPSVALGLFLGATVIRLTRASMLEALSSNYIKMARIKGVPEWKVVWKHGLANAAIPALAAFPVLATLYTFNVVAIEAVFSWPGTGVLALQAANARDYQVIWAVTLFVSALVIGAGLLIDILRAAIDPRVRHGEGEAHASSAVGVV